MGIRLRSLGQARFGSPWEYQQLPEIVREIGRRMPRLQSDRWRTLAPSVNSPVDLEFFPSNTD